MKNYADWNSHFEDEFNKISAERRRKPGAFLSVVPHGADWENYLDFICREWRFGRIEEYSFCLLTLYAGVAFHNYESGDFWKPFADMVGVEEIPPMQKISLNNSLHERAQEIGLETLANSRGNDFVGTAIFQIGVPLSFWQDFLKICENLWWREDWKSFSSDEWEAFINCKVRLPRLKRFLVGNPHTARRFIEEVHDVRRLVASGADEAEIVESSFLRPEHFAAAPETEQFISPQRSLAFLNRFQLIWNENQAKISIYLPPVAAAELPAVWKFGDTEQRADIYQQEFIVNGLAFQSKLLLKFESASKTELKKIDGISSWAIFDDDTNRVVNHTRTSLPLKSYTIVSAAPLDNILMKGFDDEIKPNEKFELRDDFGCFVTRLVPLEQKAQFSFECSGEKNELRFRVKNRVEIFLLAGLDCKAAQFRLYRDTLKTDCLPVPCLTLPIDLFDEDEIDLAEKFKVSLDGQTSAGFWEKAAREDGNQAFYFWHWDENTRARKNLNLTIESEGLAIKKEFKIEVLQLKANLADCWSNLPDKFLPFVLLAQPNFKSDKGTTFDEMREMKEIVQPHGRFVNVGFFHFYENRGVLKGNGNRWQFAKSKIYFGANNDENFLRFCGNPSVLWNLLRYLAEKLPQVGFDKIEVISKKSGVTHLFLRLNEEQKRLGEKYVGDYGKRYDLTLVDENWEENL